MHSKAFISEARQRTTPRSNSATFIKQRRHTSTRLVERVSRRDSTSGVKRSSSSMSAIAKRADASAPCWLDALPLELIDREVARRHPSIPFYLAFAYGRFARYCRERYRLPRDPLSWFAHVPRGNNSLYAGASPWCAVNYAIYLPDDHPRLKSGAGASDKTLAAHANDDVVYAISMGLLRTPIKDTLESVPRYDGTTCVLHSWWDDDLDRGGGGGAVTAPPVDIVAVQQNQYDVLTVLLYHHQHHNSGHQNVLYDEATIVWYRYGVYHRDGDRPAVVKSSGTRSWHRNGALHRGDDLPASVATLSFNVTVIQMRWYRNGVWHRDGDRPALIGAREYNKTTWVQWRKQGKLHRDGDKPAHVYSSSSRHVFDVTFYRNGAKHRDGDRPAEITDHTVGWYRDGFPLAQIFGSSAWQAHANEVDHWIEHGRRGGGGGDGVLSLSQVPSCPYFGVAAPIV